MSDTATRVAGLNDADLFALHERLDSGDATVAAQVEAHHLVATEILKRGHQHGHDDDPWAAAAIVVEKTWVASPDEIVAPEGLEEAFEQALAKGGDVAIVLTVDGYVLKAEAAPAPTVEIDIDTVWDYDDPQFLALLGEGDRGYFASVASILDAGEDPDEVIVKRGNPEPLRDYWRAGGKGKINWGAGGDFTACAAAVSKYMTSEEAKGYCAIRHRETTGMWPGDKRNRTKKAADLTSTVTFTLPGGAVYSYNGDVAKHGDPSRPGYSSMHGGGSGQHLGGAGTTGGSTSLSKGDLRAVKAALPRGMQVESYGVEYARGKNHAQGRNSHGDPKPWKVSSTGSDNPVAIAIRKRDAALAAFKASNPNDVMGVRQSLAFSVAAHQGYIDGATGARPSMARSHSVGETLAGFVFGGLSGATKARDLAMEKHGSPKDPGYAAKHPNSKAGGGAKTGDKPDEIDFHGTRLKKGRDGLWDHLEPDGKGGFRLTAERAALHREIISGYVKGKPSRETPTYTVLGGGGGSGKSILQKNVDGITDEKTSVKIDADEIKGHLAKHDGRTWDEPGLAGLTHEESSLIAKGIQTAAFRQKNDVILDGTGNSTSVKLLGKVQEARDAGYVVNGVYATVPTPLAWARNVRRAETNPDRGLVPSWAVADAHSAVSDITPYIAGHFDTFRLYDMTRGMQEGPVLIAQAKQGSRLRVADPDRFKRFRAKVKQYSAKDLDDMEIPKAYLDSGDESLLPASFFE